MSEIKKKNIYSLKCLGSKSVSCDVVIKDRRLPLLQCLSASLINKDASSNFSLRKMSVKYFCCPHKLIPLQKHRYILQQKTHIKSLDT